MENIKIGTILIVIFSALNFSHGISAIEGVSNKLTRYVVRQSWVNKRGNDAVEKNFDNFNSLLAKIQTTLAAEKDKGSATAKSLTLRLQIMKALSERISSCFLGLLKVLDKNKSAESALMGQIEKDYIRNDAISVPVDQKITDFIQDFLPCDLITSKDFFNLVQVKSITINDKYYISDNDNLPQFNRYASWLESFALAVFNPVVSAESIDNKLTALQSLGLKTAVYQLIKTPREKYIKQLFPVAIKQHLEIVEKEVQEFERANKEGITASRFILVLKQLIQFNDPAYHKFINEEISSNNDLKALYEKIKDNLYKILNKKYNLSYQKIDSYTKESYKAFGLQYADFLNYYNEIQQDPVKSQSEIDILIDHINTYIARAKVQGENLTKLQSLLTDIKVLKDTKVVPPLVNGFDKLMQLQLGLRTLQALKK